MSTLCQLGQVFKVVRSALNCILPFIFIMLGKTLAFVKILCKTIKNAQQKSN